MTQLKREIKKTCITSTKHLFLCLLERIPNRSTHTQMLIALPHEWQQVDGWFERWIKATNKWVWNQIKMPTCFCCWNPLPGFVTTKLSCDLWHRTQNRLSQNSQGLTHQLHHYLFSTLFFYSVCLSANSLSIPSWQTWFNALIMFFASTKNC